MKLTYRRLKSLIKSIKNLLFSKSIDFYFKYRILFKFIPIYKILWKLLVLFIGFNFLISLPIVFAFEPLNSLVQTLRGIMLGAAEIYFYIFNWIKSKYDLFFNKDVYTDTINKDKHRAPKTE